jgi:hypothetical protein
MQPRRNRPSGPRFCLFPGYKYCGPGCSGPGAPLNAVDAACKAHDECYSRFGPSCRCDEEFLRRLRPHIHENTAEGRHARIMYRYIRLKMLFSC